jgi:alkaline phosphatase
MALNVTCTEQNSNKLFFFSNGVDRYHNRQNGFSYSPEFREPVTEQKINKVAKNIVFFLGDGMSIPTVMAARIYKGQKDGKPGEETDMTFDKFPYIALSRVSSFI